MDICEKLLYRHVDNIFTDPSLLVKFRKGADAIMGEIDAALKETGWGWKTESRSDLYRREDYELTFNVGEMSWLLIVSVLDHPTDEPIKGVCIRIRLFMDKPDFRPFYVVFWPGKVHKRETNLRDLILSVVRGLAYIACRARRVSDLIRLIDFGYILAYHDRSRLTRADLIMRRRDVPYDFVVTHHFGLHIEHGYVVPCVSAHFGIVAQEKESFDVLAEAIIDEYWKEFIGGGVGNDR